MALPQHYHNLKDYFKDVMNFLEGYQWIYKFPNTHILVNKVFEEFPPEWLIFFKDISIQQLNDLLNNKYEDFLIVEEQVPFSFQQFLKDLNRLKPNILRRTRELPKLQKTLKLGVKKSLEIIAVAPLIHEICQRTGCDWILDVGSGLGYLPQLLHKEYSYPVVGIEGSPEKVRLAYQYQQKSFPESIDSVKYVEYFLDEKSEGRIRELAGDFPGRNVCIMGLHACADLSITILKLFNQLEFAKSLVILPCCYHRLKMNGDGTFLNFPSSEVLRDVVREIKEEGLMGVPFLRLACQGSATGFWTMTEEEHRKMAHCCLFRAILQDVAEEGGSQVSRLKRKSKWNSAENEVEDPFENYLIHVKNSHILIGALCTSDDVFLCRMRDKWAQHKSVTPWVEALGALQASIQAVCENLVLLDRVGLLGEMGVNCIVEKVMDQSVSPRCHALVATRP